jgi:parallel beta-helix repeat protein
MRRPFKSRGAAAILAAGVGAALLGVAAPAHAASHTVHPGESIQAAIDAAQPGDSIKVRAGTYHENLYVNKNNIELEGDGAGRTILLPPDQATPSPCVNEDGSIFGAVCVGFGDTPVEGFELEGFTIEGFANGAFLVNTVKAEVENNVFANNEEYGAFYNESTGGRFHDNVAYGSHEAGLYFGDSENADVRIEHNEVYDNAFGIFIRDAANGRVRENYAHDNGFGIFLLDAGAPFAPTGWRVRYNRVLDNSASFFLEEGEGEPIPFSGGGIVLAGASNNDIRQNEVKDNVPSGPSIGSGGIVLLDSTEFGGSPSSDNLIRRNHLEGNEPYDINDEGGGTGNTFRRNRCDTSQPPDLCGHGDNGDDGGDDGDDGDEGDV